MNSVTRRYLSSRSFAAFFFLPQIISRIPKVQNYKYLSSPIVIHEFFFFLRFIHELFDTQGRISSKGLDNKNKNKKLIKWT